MAGNVPWLISITFTGLFKCHLHDQGRAAAVGEYYRPVMTGTAGTLAWQQAVKIVSTQNQLSSPLLHAPVVNLIQQEQKQSK